MPPKSIKLDWTPAYKNNPWPVITGRWDGHDPDSFEKNTGELAGGLFWISLVDPTRVAFTWDPVALEPANGLTELRRICTKHTWAYYGFFKPTVEEVWEQIPTDLAGQVVSFETLTNDVRLDGDYHLATTILYGIDKTAAKQFCYPAVSTRTAQPKQKKPTVAEQIKADPRFKQTKYLVNANSFESHTLWRDWHYLPNIKNEKFMEHKDAKSPVKTWEQNNPGWLETVGMVDGRPTCVSVSWDIINGELVCFYDGTSQLVDHALIDEWIEKTFTARKCSTNAMNFHNLMQELNANEPPGLSF